MPTSPTAINTLPTAPSRADPVNFAARADAFLEQLPIFGTEANAVALVTYNNAVEAADSASTASVQAVAAANSASSASASASAAAEAFDSFDDRYLGAKTADPTLDNDNQTLIIGALYWNSVSSEMRAYNGTAWQVSYLPETSYVQLSNTQTLTNKTIEAGTFTNGYIEETVTANTSTAYTIDLANGSIQILTLTGNCTFTFPTATSGKSFMLLLKQDATGSRTVTWPATVKWPSATAPTISSTASKLDKFVFTADGSNWYGSVAGQNYTV